MTRHHTYFPPTPSPTGKPRQAIIITEIFKFFDNATHNLRSGQVLERTRNRSNNFGVESISTSGGKWNPSNYRCRLCKTYVFYFIYLYLDKIKILQ